MAATADTQPKSHSCLKTLDCCYANSFLHSREVMYNNSGLLMKV